MTGHLWLSANLPSRLLEYLRGRASDRKLRIFACDCARRLRAKVGGFNDDEQSSRVLQGEALAEGRISAAELAESPDDVRGIGEYSAHSCALYVGDVTTEEDAWLAAWRASELASQGFGMLAQASSRLANVDYRTLFRTGRRDEHVVQLVVLRDIFGNPFRPVAFDPAWRTSDAVALARQMYEARDFSAMPILADALQDAGCENDDVLNHCRDPHATHVRGCWVVDLVLGKA